MKETKKAPWWLRLVQSLGLANRPHQAQLAIRGTSKHARARTRPMDWDKKRRKARLMAKESRRRNR